MIQILLTLAVFFFQNSIRFFRKNFLTIRFFRLRSDNNGFFKKILPGLFGGIFLLFASSGYAQITMVSLRKFFQRAQLIAIDELHLQMVLLQRPLSRYFISWFIRIFFDLRKICVYSRTVVIRLLCLRGTFSAVECFLKYYIAWKTIVLETFKAAASSRKRVVS